jgi:hypothetical protein
MMDIFFTTHCVRGAENAEILHFSFAAERAANKNHSAAKLHKVGLQILKYL